MTGPIDRQTISEELRRVLDSRAFARSARSRDLLRYLVDRHIAQDVDRLKEAVIAIDVFKRGAANFDGDRDGIVRVSINRLREHLDRFYKLESEGCQLRFEIPRGSYAYGPAGSATNRRAAACEYDRRERQRRYL
jgi:hypothetical protein